MTEAPEGIRRIYLRPPPKPVPKPALQLRTDRPGWAQYAIDALSDRRDVLVVHGDHRIRLDGTRFTLDYPIWSQLKNALAQGGIEPYRVHPYPARPWPAGVRQHIPRAAAIAARAWLAVAGGGLSADEIADRARRDCEGERVFGFLNPRYGLTTIFDTAASRQRLRKWLAGERRAPSRQGRRQGRRP